MRINVYTEELLPAPNSLDKPKVAEIVWAEYTSSRTGEKMRNWGVRIYLKSAPELHYIPGRDDDRSAVTFWCGSKEKNVIAFLDMIRQQTYASTLDTWHEKTAEVQAQATESERLRNLVSEYACPVCGVKDRNMYLRCNRPDCPDGRDRR